MKYVALLALAYLFLGIKYIKKRFKDEETVKREDLFGYTVFWLIFWFAEDLKDAYTKFWETRIKNPFKE